MTLACVCAHVDLVLIGVWSTGVVTQHDATSGNYTVELDGGDERRVHVPDARIESLPVRVLVCLVCGQSGSTLETELGRRAWLHGAGCRARGQLRWRRRSLRRGGAEGVCCAGAGRDDNGARGAACTAVGGG